MFPWNSSPLPKARTPDHGLLNFPRQCRDRYTLCRMPEVAPRLNSRTKLLLALPFIAAFVLVLVYFQLFTSPVAIVIIFVLYVAVSIRNRRKFNRQQDQTK
jgi:Flp pilus assembly protein TadB